MALNSLITVAATEPSRNERLGGSVTIRHNRNHPLATDLGYTPKLAGFGPKYDLLLFANERGSLDIHYLDDPHPEAGWKAFFGKIWYEGQPEPKYTWQSTGGESSFEPKLSMVPLMDWITERDASLFAVPISILAALYSSQFLSRRWSKSHKTDNGNHSLSSFCSSWFWLHFGWLYSRNKVPSIILIILMIPGISLLFGYSWSRLRKNTRQSCRKEVSLGNRSRLWR